MPEHTLTMPYSKHQQFVQCYSMCLLVARAPVQHSMLLDYIVPAPSLLMYHHSTAALALPDMFDTKQRVHAFTDQQRASTSRYLQCSTVACRAYSHMLQNVALLQHVPKLKQRADDQCYVVIAALLTCRMRSFVSASTVR
jgi:hypothetical protein